MIGDSNYHIRIKLFKLIFMKGIQELREYVINSIYEKTIKCGKMISK
jgi:hypothetical protein